VIAGHSPAGSSPILDRSCGCAMNQKQSEIDVQAITQAVLERLKSLNR
jgi:hypothetical protein